VIALAFALHVTPEQVRKMDVGDYFAALAFMSTSPEERK